MEEYNKAIKEWSDVAKRIIEFNKIQFNRLLETMNETSKVFGKTGVTTFKQTQACVFNKDGTTEPF